MNNNLNKMNLFVGVDGSRVEVNVFESSKDSISGEKVGCISTELVPKKLSPSGRLNCPICNYKSACNCNYQSHIATHADPFDKTMFKCTFCGKGERTLLSLREHMFVHDDFSKKLKCFVCNVFCKSKADFNDHIWLHKNLDKQNIFECLYCNHKACSVNTMKMHMLTHIYSIAVQQCCLCHYKSKSKGDFLRHLTTHKESPTLDVFKCHLCEYKTKLLSNMRLHLSTHYNENEELKCSLCDCKCRDKHDLAKHFLYHKASSSLDLFKCSFCRYKTVYLGDFRLHLLKHNRSSNNSKFCFCQYSCNLCEYKTVHEYEFELHLKNLHKIYDYYRSQTEVVQNEQPFSQEGVHAYCSERGPSKFTFYNARYETLGKPNNNFKIRKTRDSSKSRNYQCEVCSFHTDRFKIFKRHKEVHKDRLERRLFYCSSCGSDFTTKANLKQHSLLHMNPEERPMLSCEMCKYKTIYKSHFKKHVSRHLKNANLESVTTEIVLSAPENQVKHQKNPLEGEVFDNNFSTALNEESSVHVNPEEKTMLHCKICEFKTTSQSYFKKHRSKHSKEAKMCSDITDSKVNDINATYKCNECSYQTKFPLNLKRHEQTHKRRGERQLFQCATCNSTYTTKKALKEHILQHHVIPRSSPKYQCYDCEFATAHKLEMRSHRLSHQTNTQNIST